MSAGGPHAVRHQEGARVDGRDIKVNGPARRSSLRPARCSGAAATGPRPWTTSPTPRGSAGPCCCITSRPRRPSSVISSPATPPRSPPWPTGSSTPHPTTARPPPPRLAGVVDALLDHPEVSSWVTIDKGTRTMAPAPDSSPPRATAAPAAGRNHRWSRRRAARHRGRRCGHQALRPPTPRAAIRPTRPARCSSRTRNELPLGAVRAASCGRVGKAPLRGKSATRR